MFSKLKIGLVAAIGFLVAGLLFVVGQRDKARAKVKQVQVEKATVEANQALERTVSRVQADARKTSQETRREHEDRPDDRRPDGNFRR